MPFLIHASSGAETLGFYGHHCYKISVDVVQHTLSQNISPWHTENFKLKESEETAQAGTLLLSSTALLETVQKKPSCDRYPPYT